MCRADCAALTSDQIGRALAAAMPSRDAVPNASKVDGESAHVEQSVLCALWSLNCLANPLPQAGSLPTRTAMAMNAASAAIFNYGMSR